MSNNQDPQVLHSKWQQEKHSHESLQRDFNRIVVDYHDLEEQVILLKEKLRITQGAPQMLDRLRHQLQDEMLQKDYLRQELNDLKMNRKDQNVQHELTIRKWTDALALKDQELSILRAENTQLRQLMQDNTELKSKLEYMKHTMNDKRSKMKAYVKASSTEAQTLKHQLEQFAADQERWIQKERAFKQQVQALKKDIEVSSRTERRVAELVDLHRAVSEELEEKSQQAQEHKEKRLYAKSEAQKLAQTLDEFQVTSSLIAQNISVQSTQTIVKLNTMTQQLAAALDILEPRRKLRPKSNQILMEMQESPIETDITVTALTDKQRIDHDMQLMNAALVDTMTEANRVCQAIQDSQASPSFYNCFNRCLFWTRYSPVVNNQAE